MNPYHLSYDKKKFFDQFATTLHEVYHIMGFSKALYGYYINPDTLTRKELSDTFIDKKSGTFPWRIRSPKVLEFARQYFNCPSMDGIPVEDEGGSGSAGSHWEKLVLGNEMMVGDQVANPVLSGFTLKLLEDSGWYKINYSMQEPIFWEKGVGCTVLSGQCSQHRQTCKNSGDEGCFYDYTFQARCSKGQFTNGCVFFTGTDFNKHDCRVSSNADQNTKGLGETFGLGSRCFKGQLKVNGTTHGNLCYKSRCESGQVVLEIGGQSYKCLSTGQQINPTGFSGYVECPNIQDFCTQYEASCTDDCNLNGRCLSSDKCYCYPGFKGATCGDVDPNSTAVSYTNYSQSGNGGAGCPDNCYNRGDCNNNVCTCMKGFTGRACASIDILAFFSSTTSIPKLFNLLGAMLLIILSCVN